MYNAEVVDFFEDVQNKMFTKHYHFFSQKTVEFH